MKITSRLSAMVFAGALLAMPAFAVSPESSDVTAQFAKAGLHVNGLHAVEVGGIVVLRGKATDPAEIARAESYAHTLGFARVANVIALHEPADDAAIQRNAERRLASARALDGCKLHVQSTDGVVLVAGQVNSELQKDVAVDVLRGIDGVREVHSTLTR